jgi:hypothetical protein
LPEHLWTLAAELAQEYGLNRTARTLRLDYHGLKKRMELPISGEVSSALPPSAFLELRPTEAHSSVACTIECEAGQGGRMRIHLQGHELPDLAALIGSFWSRQR